MQLRKHRYKQQRCDASLHVPTCMAPRFSVSCSGLDVPRSTELTPSFLRHHAGERRRMSFTQWPLDGALLPVIVSTTEQN